MTRLRHTTLVSADLTADTIDAPTLYAEDGHEPGALSTASDGAMPIQIIVLEGEFDLSNVRHIEHAVEEGIDAGARDFIADLSGVDFLDGTAVHALLDGWKRAARRNGRFVLVNPPDRIWRVFVLIGVSRTFATFASPQEALASFADGHA